VLGANQAELFSGPEAKSDGVVDLEEREAEGDVEDGDGTRAVIVDTLEPTNEQEEKYARKVARTGPAGTESVWPPAKTMLFLSPPFVVAITLLVYLVSVVASTWRAPVRVAPAAI
jgi:hypothetical protein